MRHARPALLGLACITALSLAAAPASAGVFGSRRKPVAPPVAPPPSYGPPPVAALPGPVLQAAGAYRAYLRRASGVTAAHAGAELESALELAEASEPLGLSRGAVAYAAVIALQEPGFVEGVRTYAADASQRRTVADRLAADASYAAAMPSAAAAAARISQALAVDGSRVVDAGRVVKQSAYDMQRQSWSKTDIPNRPGRLARAKTLAATPMAATPEDMAALANADAAASPGPGSGPGAASDPPRLIEASMPVSSGPPYPSTVLHGMAIAALAALGETGDANDAVVQTLLNDATGSYCHNMAKLNLYQCLAVAKPYYEDAFCLGQHVLIDTGQCVLKVAGALPPVPLAAALPEASSKPAATKTRPPHHRR